MKNQYVRDMLIDTFGYKCWLGGKVSKENPLTLHHIIPVREGGKTTIENGALISLQKHTEFNVLEQMYPELGEEINSYLYEYRGNYPQEVWDRIQEIWTHVNDHAPIKQKNNYRKKTNYQKHLKKKRR